MSSRSPVNLSHEAPSASRTGLHENIAVPRAWPFSRIGSLWVWWHLLSLDAPTVAVVWCWFFGAVFHVKFPWETLPTLALGTWCVYVADRILDGARSTDTSSLRDRHWFYLRHRNLFIAIWVLAAIPLAYLIFFRIDPAVRADDILLCLIGIAYFLFIHGSPASTQQRLFPVWFPKELAVGFLFAIATAVPAWVRLEPSANILISSRAIFVAAVFIFGTLCWLNCVAIQTWEDNEAHQEIVHAILAANPSARSTRESRGLTPSLGKNLIIFASTVAILSLVPAIATANRSSDPVFISVVISAGIFLGLVRYSRRFSALALRIAADAALLTPLLFLIAIR